MKQTEFSIYSINGSVAAGAVLDLNLNIRAGADFEVLKLTYSAYIAAGLQTDSTRVIPLVTSLITDTATGRPISNSPIPLADMFGCGELPFILPMSKIFAARSSQNIQLTNFSAATTYLIYLNFIGREIW